MASPARELSVLFQHKLTESDAELAVAKLGWPRQHEKAISEVLQTLVSEHSYPGLAQELAWGAIQGKLPSRPVIDLLEKIKSKEPIILLLRELLTAHIGN